MYDLQRLRSIVIGIEKKITHDGRKHSETLTGVIAKAFRTDSSVFGRVAVGSPGGMRRAFGSLAEGWAEWTGVA